MALNGRGAPARPGPIGPGPTRPPPCIGPATSGIHRASESLPFSETQCPAYQVPGNLVHMDHVWGDD